MKDQGFTTSITVGRSPEFVFSRLTDVSKWWGGPDLEGSSSKLNDEFTIIHGDAHYSKQQVVEFNPGGRLVWLVAESRLNWLKNMYEWTNTRMIFEIAASGHQTVINFTHEGLVPEKECYARCAEGWQTVITERLHNFIIHDVSFYFPK